MQDGAIFGRRHVLALGAGLAATAAGLAATPLVARTPATRTVTRGAFGTTWSATLPDGVDMAVFVEAADAMLADLDAALSPWRPDSAVSVFNRAGRGGHAQGRDLLAVARRSLGIAAASGGHFDPTVGPLVARYGFGPIETGAPRPDWRHLAVEGKALVKTNAGTTFDPCGIAKGHALDRLAALAQDTGAQAGFVEFGGEVVAWGHHPDGRMWQAGVEDPRVGSTGLVGIIALDGAAIATSGNRVNGYDFAGRSYGHIIDPARGAPVRTPLLSVSVVAPTAMEADGWATALMAAGPGDAHALARDNDLNALIVSHEGNGLALTRTGRIAALMKEV
jgi:thiamine biosynthesis lipoprotein